MRDFKRLRNDPPQGVNGSPNPDNIMLWNAVIFGPEDTPWDGGARPHAPARAPCMCVRALARLSHMFTVLVAEPSQNQPRQ
jgi:hypothetical protein